MFLNDESFARFDREPEIRELTSGSFWETHDYHDVPDYGFHGGITWYSRDIGINKFTGKPEKFLKIGCDYNHLWDREGGYSDDLDSVERDAKRLIESLIEAHPIKTKCDYCGVLDKPENFYVSRNGRNIHNSQKDKFTPEHWPDWMPEDATRLKEKDQPK